MAEAPVWPRLWCGRDSGVAAAVAADSGLLFLPAAGQTPAQPKVLPNVSAAAAAATSDRCPSVRSLRLRCGRGSCRGFRTALPPRRRPDPSPAESPSVCLRGCSRGHIRPLPFGPKPPTPVWPRQLPRIPDCSSSPPQARPQPSRKSFRISPRLQPRPHRTAALPYESAALVWPRQLPRIPDCSSSPPQARPRRDRMSFRLNPRLQPRPHQTAALRSESSGSGVAAAVAADSGRISSPPQARPRRDRMSFRLNPRLQPRPHQSRCPSVRIRGYSRGHIGPLHFRPKPRPHPNPDPHSL